MAIKVIRPELANDPDFIRRFQAEAQLVARLEHPHIVPLYDYWREPDAAYLVMRLMRGGSLATVLEHGALSPAQTTTMVDQLGNALQTAHRSGVVHGDIKPANVLIDDEGNAYLSDFGIAVGADGGTSDVPSARSTLGAPYASPEQLDRGEVTATSDIYSLGVVVAQALTGLSGEVAQIRGALPPPVLRVIDRATDVDATDALRKCRRPSSPICTRRSAASTSAGSRGHRPSADVEVDNPYKGLRAFDAADAVDFYGRERLVERLIARLGQPGARGRFIAVVGPERQRQVERREGRAAPRDPARGGPAVGFVVHDRDDPRAPSVRGARRCAARRRRRPAGLAARAARGRARAAAGASPRVAERRLAAAAVDRPVRGAVHAGRHGHREPVPRHAS